VDPRETSEDKHSSAAVLLYSKLCYCREVLERRVFWHRQVKRHPCSKTIPCVLSKTMDCWQ